jgi:erythromycin esterase
MKFLFPLLRSTWAVATLGCATFASAQLLSEAEKVEWLKAHAVKIGAIDPRDTNADDYSDLEPLRSLVGDCRIVMLGEATHEDGATYLAKIRLVKFLHQEMGFEVLAIEGDSIGYRGLNEALRDSKTSLAEASRRVAWRVVSEMDLLYEHVRQNQDSPKPLILEGIDYMITSPWAERKFLADLATFFDPLENEPLSEEHLEFIATARSWAHHRTRQVPDSSEDAVERIEELMKVVESRREPLIAAHGKEHFELMRRYLAGFRHNYIYGKTAEDGTRWNIRDRGMASNVEWLAKEVYPDKKMIIWAASAHTAQRLPEVVPNFPNSFSLGQGVVDAFGEKVYSVAFVSYDGELGAVVEDRPAARRKMTTAPEGSLEHLLTTAGFEYALVDMKRRTEGHWLRGPINARPMGHSSYTARWSRNFDAFFFIRTNFPFLAR